MLANAMGVIKTTNAMIKAKVLFLSFVWMLSSELLRSQNCQGRHRGLRLPLVSPAPVKPEPVVAHQHQEGLVQGPGVKQLL